MATKAYTYKTVTADVKTFCQTQKIAKDTESALLDLLKKHLAPRPAGASINLDKVTKQDKDGNVTEIQCAVSKVFLPATEEYFYKGNTGIEVNGVTLRRLSKQAERIRKSHAKWQQVTEAGILQDMLSGNIGNDEAAKAVEEVKNSKPDYSSVGLV